MDNKKYLIKIENPKSLIEEIDMKLGTIEVKGDSVASLFTARLILKELFNSIEEIKEESEKDSKTKEN